MVSHIKMLLGRGTLSVAQVLKAHVEQHLHFQSLFYRKNAKNNDINTSLNHVDAGRSVIIKKTPQRNEI